MAGTLCVVCGKNPGRMVSSPKNPDKYVCMSCLNQLVFNLKTLGEELEPLAEAVEKGVDAVDRELGKKS
jgi:hypothetical protein